MSVWSFIFTVHLNGDQNLRSKMLTTPKLKELQVPKVRRKQLVLGATIPPNLMSFRCTVMEKWRQNIAQHNCMHDGLYHPCTFAWDKVKRLLQQN